jgi:EAL domain-containing protein (putative c-di-GMP-specific phosphodiesterase class I)
VPIGRWVLREACSRMHEWNARYAPAEPVAICVNVAPKQFERRILVQTVREILEETGLDPRLLDIEVTENLTMQDACHAGEILRDLAAVGVSLSLDDFGTGYSSLSYLHRFPIRTLKIDRSFIAQIENCKESREIVQTIVALGRGLGMKVVAEGIETEAQMDHLRSLRCDLGQGYLFSPPVPKDKVADMFAARLLDVPLGPQKPDPESRRSRIRTGSWEPHGSLFEALLSTH